MLELVKRIDDKHFEGYTLTLKIKFSDFTQITRSATVDKVLRRKDDILPLAKQLLAGSGYERMPIRLIGLSVSNPQLKDAGQDKQHGGWVEGTLPFKGYAHE